MSSNTHTNYYCDLCDGKLPDRSPLAIVTETQPSIGWERFRVTVEHHSGMHNEGTVKPADLCQTCAITLLTDALLRVQKGERESAGVSEIEMVKFS